MKYIIIFFALIGSLRAETYYISVTGNDSNSGLTPALAWATLEKIEGFTFAAGDSVLFKAGDIFQGDLFVPASNLYIGRYENGVNPTFKGDTIPAASWVSKGGGIYKSDPAGYNFHGGSRLWIDDVPIFPNATDSLLTDGDVYFHNSTDAVFVRYGSDPSNHDSRFVYFITWFQCGIHLDTVSNVTIENIDFVGMESGIVSDQDCSNILVQNCNFRYLQSAVLLAAVDTIKNVTFRNNYFYRCHSAIRFYTSFWYHGAGDYEGAQFVNCNVIGNEFHQAGYVNDEDSIWADGAQDYEAFGCQNWSGSEVAYNYYHDGYQIGCIYYANDTFQMNDNLIHDNLFIDNDKIFFHTSGDAQDAAAGFGFSGNKIYNNVIVNSGSDAVENNLWFRPGTRNSRYNWIVNNTCIEGTRVGCCDIEVVRDDLDPWLIAKNNLLDNGGFEIYGSGSFVPDTSNNVFTDESVWLLDAKYRPMIGSPVINVGTSVGLFYRGNAPDVGAREGKN